MTSLHAIFKSEDNKTDFESMSIVNLLHFSSKICMKM